NVGVKGEYSTGQKERRIIDSLVGAMQRHKVVLHPRVFESDKRWNKQHSVDKRIQRSLFFQISNITTDRDSLPHDDRIEALTGCVRWHKSALILDEEAAARARREAEAREHCENPMGYEDPAYQRAHTKTRGTRGQVHRRRYR